MQDYDVPLIVLGSLIVMVSGVALFWLAPQTYSRPDQFPLNATAMRTAGATLLVIGILVAVLFATQFIAVIAIPVVIVIMLVANRKYYAAETESLMWVLLSAAERGIALEVAARAYASERSDLLGYRATKLADYLEAGVPLGLSLQRSGFAVEPEVALAADLGYQTGNLGPALRQVVERSEIVESATAPIATRLIYVGLIVVHLLIAQAFLLLKIIPIFLMMHHELESAPPSSTLALAASSEIGTGESYVFGAFVIVGMLALLIGLLWILGSPLRSLPVIRSFWWRVDCSWIMRWLAVGVQQGRPILEMLRLLSGYFPQPAIRRRLQRSAARVEQGGHWCDGLYRFQLIRRSECNLLKAAERAGNLPWALEQMADSSLRRWTYRLQVWMNVLFPISLIVLGFAVLFVVLTVFSPLISLIEGAS